MELSPTSPDSPLTEAQKYSVIADAFLEKIQSDHPDVYCNIGISFEIPGEYKILIITEEKNETIIAQLADIHMPGISTDIRVVEWDE